LPSNATIERRAPGRPERAFAVVASEGEVRFAAQTQRPPEEISSQIGTIQSTTDEAVQGHRADRRDDCGINGLSPARSAAVEEQGRHDPRHRP